MYYSVLKSKIGAALSQKHHLNQGRIKGGGSLLKAKVKSQLWGHFVRILHKQLYASTVTENPVSAPVDSMIFWQLSIQGMFCFCIFAL